MRLFFGLVWFSAIANSSENNGCGDFACSNYLWGFLTVAPISCVVCSLLTVHIFLYLFPLTVEKSAKWNASHCHHHRSQPLLNHWRVIKIVFINSRLCDKQRHECVTLYTRAQWYGLSSVDTPHY